MSGEAGGVPGEQVGACFLCMKHLLYVVVGW